MRTKIKKAEVNPLREVDFISIAENKSKLIFFFSVFVNNYYKNLKIALASLI